MLPPRVLLRKKSRRLGRLCDSTKPGAKFRIALPSMLGGGSGGRWLRTKPSIPRPPTGSASGRQPLPTHLRPIIAEDPHHTDRNCFVQTAPQSFAVQSKHEGNVLYAGVVDDGVQGVIQPAWRGHNDRETRHMGHGGTPIAKDFFLQIATLPSYLLHSSVACAVSTGESRVLQCKRTVPLGRVEGITLPKDTTSHQQLM